MRIATALAMLAAGLLTFTSPQASNLRLETSHLIISDNTGKLSDERLRELANHAQETLNKVLAFWSADPLARGNSLRQCNPFYCIKYLRRLHYSHE